MKALFNVGLFFLVGYSVLLVCLYLFQSRLIYIPNIAGTNSKADPSLLGLRYEDVNFQTADGVELNGWFIPAPEARAVLLFMHGNAGNITHRLDSIALFNRLGLSVFIFDYRGYGKSAGRPTEQGTYDDATAAWQYLTQDRRLAPENIVIFGRSLGAAIAAELASRTEPAALIIESPFTSVADVAADLYWFFPVRALVRIHYDTRSSLEKISCPLLVIHSMNDEIIPVAHGRRLFAEAREPKDYLELAGGHNDGFMVSETIYLKGWNEFLDRLVN